jgi:hypothetical protein
MSPRSNSQLRSVVLFVAALVALLAAAGFAAGRLSAAPTARPSIVTTVLEPSCTSITATAAFSKVADLGTFEVQSAESLVETTFHGRLYAVSTDGSGVRFELRVDDAASATGRIRGLVKENEMGNIPGNFAVGSPVSMGGFWEGLSVGTHTVSLWAQVANGTTAANAMFDPGCWSSDHVMIKEYLPFGTVALPAILRE